MIYESYGRNTSRNRARIQPNKMWSNQKLMQHSPQLLQPPALPPPQTQTISIKQCCKVSRRELAICTNSSLLLLLGSQTVEPLHHSRARAEEIEDTSKETEQLVESEENEVPRNSELVESEVVPPSTEQPVESEDDPQKTEQLAPEDDSKKTADPCGEQNPTQRAFLEVSIDGVPLGRIVIGLYSDSVPFGTARFSDLVSGAAGISYRRKEFVKITPNYVQHSGVRSYGVDAELARKAGSNLAADRLTDEWEKQYAACPGTKNLAKSIGIVVRDPSKPPPKLKLIARKGKLEIDQEQVGVDPNGTEFVIAIKDSPELDASTLVIGRVLEGMDVVEKIGQVKTVQENTSSPYFRVAKLIGDKRAVVAERGFNRPYSKVLITNCGLIK
ncbi:peptidyl-prolyl cis-trans isomerase CYP26-2, chloroplastic [Coffea arabica]|uniref:Peptidyl-prolyl cis-trans isomerase CYP26-2, chloroplastic n=1 Tax=Coffea arabica TaxID=13443 RepID=A0ABM4U3J6_COFAR